jgi:23S rRNA (adenine2503-C2)-methyltransferase
VAEKTQKLDIKNLSCAELGEKLKSFGAEEYRAKQIMKWLYSSGARSFDEMTDLPVDLRKTLKALFHLSRLSLLDSKRSKIDGTTKYLFKLEDGNTIETVFLPEARRATACLSSQVGCKFGCTFCASSPFGFVRDLKASEIADEVLSVRAENPQQALTNLVFMGIGEPFDNYDNVMKAIRIFNDESAFAIGARRITISTCGIIPGIERLKKEGLQVELSVSLHSADDHVRSKLLPINKKYPLKELIASCREYVKSTNRVITFEYILIKGVNCSEEDALRVADLVKGLKCKVNTISYNRITEDFAKPSEKEVKVFLDVLRNRKINVTHRKSKGEDIDAGCGQLRISRL